jgi:hypothetical protein
MITTNNFWFSYGETRGDTVYEPEQVKHSQILGPDGLPYVIVQKKNKLGFDITRSANK